MTAVLRDVLQHADRAGCRARLVVDNMRALVVYRWTAASGSGQEETGNESGRQAEEAEDREGGRAADEA